MSPVEQEQALRDLIGCVHDRVAGILGTVDLPALGNSTLSDRAEKAPSAATLDLAPLLDHTILKPDATHADIQKLCDEAIEHGFASVCVNSSHVDLCAERVKGSNVKVCTVAGFPLGAVTSESKARETAEAVRRGADEIDMVIHVGRLKDADYVYTHRDIQSVVDVAEGRTVKVILECCLLTDIEKIAGCLIARAAGAHFVKTSTGFSTGGATARDVALMRRVVGDAMGVKAAGGIRDAATAREMIRAGASRLGASASVAIVRERD